MPRTIGATTEKLPDKSATHPLTKKDFTPQETFMFAQNDESCQIKEEQPAISSNKPPNSQGTRLASYDTRLVRIVDAATSEFGTGYLISPNYILTANHIVDNPDTSNFLIYSPSNQIPLKAVVVSQDKEQDLALIKLQERALSGNGDYVSFRSDIGIDEKITIRTINTIDEKYERLSSQIYISGRDDSSDNFPEGWKEQDLVRFGIYENPYIVDLQTTTGTSGSPIFDEQGRIIGNHNGGLILIDERKSSVGYIGTLDIIKQTKLSKEIYPDAVFISFSPEPGEIVNFLRDYCNDGTDNNNPTEKVKPNLDAGLDRKIFVERKGLWQPSYSGFAQGYIQDNLFVTLLVPHQIAQQKHQSAVMNGIH
jgi:V8-like Glu-specific endopeptidase